MLTEANVRINSLAAIPACKTTPILSENTWNLMLAAAPLAWYPVKNVVARTG
jgi:hypothetical protein